MPFCDISTDVSLYYTTNSIKGDATDLDPEKPTIILLPPLFCSVTWLREQFWDRRLSDHYNLIAFDPRNIGLTKAPLSPKRDSWVDAADIAVAHELLQLPPCHIFAVAITSCGAALRFAVLFPEKCLSLGLCSPPVQAGEEPEWLSQGYQDFTYGWCYPQDIDALERASMEFSWFCFNGQISSELEDEFIAWWQTNLPATRRTSFLTHALCATFRTRLSDKELDSIKQPTLLILGEKSEISPPPKSKDFSSKIPDCKSFVVKGGPVLMNAIPEYATIVNRVYLQFLLALPGPPIFHTSQPDPEAVCKAGLTRLATWVANPSIAKRDPTNTLSFCAYSPELIEQNAGMLTEFAKGEKDAFHALDERGQPIRKFSDRHMDEWTPATLLRKQEYSNKDAVGPLVTVTESVSISQSA